MGLIRWIFFKRKHLAYTAFGDDMYYPAVSKFSAHGIAYDAVLKVNANVHGTEGHIGSSRMHDAMTSTAQYDFYVATKDQHRAQQALHG
ncbi:hypothetical protein BBH88_17930 [Planococcus antarcticus DSM 14505]|uniref:Uncharacterized protein n=2 Tax=Planococcus TaxID=1372 RepID=A0ABN4RJ02_9BACL|nr:hypothetical protein BBH88_17930 [Planococcus antarcticus DSM 14505]